MTEPISRDHAVPTPFHVARWRRLACGLASLALVLEIALGLRIATADAVEWAVRREDPTRLCVFRDTVSYWELARTIRAGGPYEIVEWADIPHFALRTPGYPLVLAACQAVFGERTLAVRLVQAGLGMFSVYLVYCLARRFVEHGTRFSPFQGNGRQSAPHGPVMQEHGASQSDGGAGPCWTIPLVAAGLAAVNPHYLLMSSLILSEAVFVPLMLASLLGMATLWPRSATGPSSSSRPVDGSPPVGSSRRGAGWRADLVALGTGVSAGAAVLVRPSWVLFIPAMLGAWILASLRHRKSRGASLRGSIICMIGVVAIMSPWWVRNAQVYGRFVPTALWMGASLYDGLNPRATGASDMSFLSDPEIWPLDEQDQDAELTRRAFAFARENPGRTLALAASKLGRYWSPWPNADGFRSAIVAVGSAVVELPIFVLMAMGLWASRRDPRAWVLLAGPLLYFCALHMAFASSMRYRIPAEIPGLGLAAIGWARISTNRVRAIHDWLAHAPEARANSPPRTPPS